MVRRGLARLVRSVGLAAETYSSPRELLAQGRREAPGCIVLDLRMPDLDGLQAQEALAQAGYTHAGRVSHRARRCLQQRHGDEGRAPSTSWSSRWTTASCSARSSARSTATSPPAPSASRPARCASGSHLLTPREREVCDLVVAGLRNKQIADRLGTAEKTVKIHRGQVMHKLGVRSVVELVRLVDRLGDGRRGGARECGRSTPLPLFARRRNAWRSSQRAA